MLQSLAVVFKVAGHEFFPTLCIITAGVESQEQGIWRERGLPF